MLRSAVAICNEGKINFHKTEGDIVTLLVDTEELKVKYFSLQKPPHSRGKNTLTRTSNYPNTYLAINKLAGTLNNISRNNYMELKNNEVPIETLQGLTVVCNEGDVGIVEDIVVEDNTWNIQYLIVKTGAWIKRNKIAMDVNKLGEINISDGSISFNTNYKTIKKENNSD
ncbi:MAG: hypothetical protein U9N32_07580 [Spirochaetota bacterium]|nr:hypothetical protein [Spirochaetota bacterium]